MYINFSDSFFSHCNCPLFLLFFISCDRCHQHWPQNLHILWFLFLFLSQIVIWYNQKIHFYSPSLLLVLWANFAVLLNDFYFCAYAILFAFDIFLEVGNGNFMYPVWIVDIFFGNCWLKIELWEIGLKFTFLRLCWKF